MRRMISLAWVLLVLPAVAGAQQLQKPSAAVPSTAQSAPALPQTLINTPPVPPVVRMQNGMLSIDAPNCTLADVLSAVQVATGAVVEGAASNERVAVKLGPGDARDVIAALLHGSSYNYIILGSQENPRAVTRIVLSKASKSHDMGPAARVPQPPPSPPEAEENQTGVASGGNTPAPPRVPQPRAVPSTPHPPTPQGAATSKPKNAPPTPEELFRQLQLPLHPQQQKEQTSPAK